MSKGSVSDLKGGGNDRNKGARIEEVFSRGICGNVSFTVISVLPV